MTARELRNGLLVAAVACLAAVPSRCYRWLRRALGQKPRILRGPTPMIGMSYSMRADRAYGYRSDLVVTRLDGFPYPYVFRSEVTDVLREWKGPSALRLLRTILLVLYKYDIVVAFFDGGWLRHTEFHCYEFPLLRLAGIKTVVAPYGSDVQTFDGMRTRFDWVGRLWEDYEDAYGDREEHNRKVRAQVDRYLDNADFVISLPFLTPFLRRADLEFGYFAIDVDEWTPQYETRNETPVVVHAPNHRMVKGTDYLLDACERLRRERVELELRLIEGVPRNEVRDRYRDADVFADQFVIGDTGLGALEGLALGKPTLVYLSEEVLTNPAFNLPFVNANPDNLADVLKVLVSLPELRARLGRAGREAVVAYRSMEAVGEVWDRIYRHLWFGAPLDLETTRIFDPARRARPLCEDPRRPEFWPVEVGDIIDEIRAVLGPAPCAIVRD